LKGTGLVFDFGGCKSPCPSNFRVTGRLAALAKIIDESLLESKQSYTFAMGDRKPKKNSSGNSDAHKAKQTKNAEAKLAANPKDEKDKKKK
jgi:hypothetical protein